MLVYTLIYGVIIAFTLCAIDWNGEEHKKIIGLIAGIVVFFLCFVVALLEQDIENEKKYYESLLIKNQIIERTSTGSINLIKK